MIEALLALALPVANIIDRENKNKWPETLLELKDEYNKENASPDCDHARLYSIERRMCDIVSILGAGIQKQGSKI